MKVFDLLSVLSLKWLTPGRSKDGPSSYFPSISRTWIASREQTVQTSVVSRPRRIWGFLTSPFSSWSPPPPPWLSRRRSTLARSSAEKWSSSAPWPSPSRMTAARSRRSYQVAPQRRASAPKASQSRFPPKMAVRYQERSRAPGRSKLSPRSQFLRLLLKRP